MLKSRQLLLFKRVEATTDALRCIGPTAEPQRLEVKIHVLGVKKIQMDLVALEMDLLRFLLC